MPSEYGKIISLLFSILILGNAFLFKRITRLWIAPPVIASFFWFFLSFIPMVVMWELPANPLAILYIHACLFLFSVSAIFLPWEVAQKKSLENRLLNLQVWDNNFLFFIFLFVQLFVLVCIPLNLIQQGFNASDFTTNFYRASGKYLTLKYAGKLTPNIFSQMSVTLNYLGVMLGGLLLPVKPGYLKKSFIVILSLIPSLVFMVLLGDKGTIFLALALFYGGILSNQMVKGRKSLLTVKELKYLIISFFILIPAVISSFLSRGLMGNSAAFIVNKVKFLMASYAFGHIFAFSDWFGASLGEISNQIYKTSDITGGYYTFSAVLNWLGIRHLLPSGIYDEYLKFPDIIQTNIYTIFRGLILDFGFVGGLTFWFVTGVFFNLTCFAMLYVRLPVISTSIFVFMVGYIYSSYIVSIFIWNSTLAATVLLMVLLFVNKIKFTLFPKGST